jgi:hypothetical protein
VNGASNEVAIPSEKAQRIQHPRLLTGRTLSCCSEKDYQ